ncbi:MAG: hypothetical protein OHK0037_04590 [Elainellaceae cyanobacterium]
MKLTALSEFGLGLLAKSWQWAAIAANQRQGASSIKLRNLKGLAVSRPPKKTRLGAKPSKKPDAE